MLKGFGHGIWSADGPNVAVVGFHYPTRLAVIRLSDGSLFIWSPIQLTDNLRTEVDAIGQVRHIIAPNSLHHLFLAEWKRAYPGAKVYAPPGLRTKRKDIVFDADLGSGASPDWVEEIDQVLMHGNLITTEAVFFHVASGTVLFADLIQQLPTSLISGREGIGGAARPLRLPAGPSGPECRRAARRNPGQEGAGRPKLCRVLKGPDGPPDPSDAPLPARSRLIQRSLTIRKGFRPMWLPGGSPQRRVKVDGTFA